MTDQADCPSQASLKENEFQVHFQYCPSLGGTGSARSVKCLLLATTALVGVAVFVRPVHAGPQGGSVVAGSATISAPTSTATVITQATSKAIINWQGFSINQGESVSFNQPGASSVILNRVTGPEASTIAGSLNANGQVFLINPNGVLFAKGASVNVGGLVASTLDISNADFLAGKYTFAGNSSAAVVNQGKIAASAGGYVSLMGKTVSNSGAITADYGAVAMTAGSKITLNFEGDSLFDVTIDKGVMNALVENKQMIRADGGKVIMTAKAADAILSAQVNNSGIVQARTMAALTGGGYKSGAIKLYAHGGKTRVSGKLDASARKGGDGGTIETSGDHVSIADKAKITTSAALGKTGTWTLDPTDFTVAASGGDMSAATLNARLGSNNIVLSTTMGATGASGNFYVNDALSWSANTSLTLAAANNLYINKTITATGDKAALNLTAAAGTVVLRDIGLVDANVSGYGYVGALIGGIYGFVSEKTNVTITNSYVGGNSTVTGNNHVGGLAGSANTIDYAYSTANVTGSTAGGLVGFVYADTDDEGFSISSRVSHAHATGPVSADGGLIGEAVDTTIDLVYSTGPVNGSDGLIGSLTLSTSIFNPSLTNSFSTGNVIGGSMAGGLIGRVNGAYGDERLAGKTITIANVYATGNVTANDTTPYGAAAGGLIGDVDLGYWHMDLFPNAPTFSITGALATGNVTVVSTIDNSGANITGAGGLVGKIEGSRYSAASGGADTGSGLMGTITNSHATGNVDASGVTVAVGYSVGGLVGSSTETSYSGVSATGALTGASSSAGRIGGLAGFFTNGAISNSFSNVTMSGGARSQGGLIGHAANAEIDSTTFYNSDANANGVGFGTNNVENNGVGLTTSQMADIKYYLDGTIGQVLADRADKAAAD
ncbi:filamentous hemagglutinin family N-terminal domain-containing protein [Rhodoblastus acidophilus]|uniref:Filamentous hemagglutinin family N-terminal domain-containing protein n=1 Tax=Rhodoblastus acidophilus TaxID=1074 RepID=A0A212S786_RHOAC|nr:filamentous hemagglutinin N-terminal domain-containing protein [Rhodoblastus acidophilus]PPQ37234.1 hypothetical protein CKO16_14880 [Rhodoblastus acidophilus]RAI17298.1 hypothetical protein CH337_16935 [Rhodoblastus acidophilus]SNB81024.1 filamentous hemagglutinin family N-terminal domain-containing protein [Rhodoblastus acidophilus]